MQHTIEFDCKKLRICTYLSKAKFTCFLELIHYGLTDNSFVKKASYDFDETMDETRRTTIFKLNYIKSHIGSIKETGEFSP